MKMANIKFKKWTDLPYSLQLNNALDFKEWHEKEKQEAYNAGCGL